MNLDLYRVFVFNGYLDPVLAVPDVQGKLGGGTSRSNRFSMTQAVACSMLRLC